MVLLLSSADFSQKIAELEVDLTALEYTELRTLAESQAGAGAGKLNSENQVPRFSNASPS